MKEHLSVIILISIFLIGFSLLLYPTVSDYINSQHQSRAIASYEEGLSRLTVEDYSNYRQAANEYNKRLSAHSDQFIITDKEKAEYDSILDPAGNGIMGYVEIGSIGVKLPIYHGTDDNVLQVGVGHIEGSSLPVGGESTHCVLSGHRGLPSSRLFTDLDQLSVGDVFLLHTLDLVLAYRVDQAIIVEPADTEALDIVDGKDYCTLVTCTPYGINSHRLLVRGVRVAYDEKTLQMMQVTADATKIEPVLVAPAFAVPMLTALFIWLIISTGRKKPKS